MTKIKTKQTILGIVDKILDSDLPVSTKNEIAKHFLLPKSGETLAPIETGSTGVSAVDRPTAEEIEIENNPILKAGDKAAEKIMDVPRNVPKEENKQ